MFEALGLSDTDERVYRRLLESPGSSADEIAVALAESVVGIRRALANLAAYGLVTDEGGGFGPTPPDIALEALIHRRRHQLERLRLQAQTLGHDFRRSHGPSTDVDEHIVAREALIQRIAHVHRIADEEMRVVKVTPDLHARTRDLETELAQRGIRYRVICTSEMLGASTAPTSNEEVRVLSHPAFDLVVADDRIAVLAIPDGEGERTDAARGLVVQGGPTLDALCLHFDSAWRCARSFRNGTGAARAGEDLDQVDRDILALLAAGLKDDAIARRVGIAQRTMQRRISKLMQLTNATTRFQIGVEAARRKWI